MLRELRIRDLGVIADATLELSPGLTVLTGETGAGKTMVVTGLGLLLGARADTALVRAGCRAAVVEGVLDLPDGHPALTRAVEAGADIDDGELVLVRSVGAEGRSRAHAGGRSTPVGVLADLAEHLVAVHGQADQWRLTRPDEHRQLLDSAGGPDLAEALAAYRTVHTGHAEAVAELTDLRERDRERARELDALTVGLERLEQISPKPDEDQALRIEDERLGHAEELRAAAEEAQGILAGRDESYAGDVDGVLGALSRARASLSAASRNDPDLHTLEDRITQVGHVVSDLASDLASYLADNDVDPGRLSWVQQRRADLSRLTRIYGDTIDDVLDWGKTAAGRHAELLGADERITSLETQVARLEVSRSDAAARLSSIRRSVAQRLSTQITDELAHLAMGTAVVTVTVETTNRFSPDGADLVEIGLAANPGSPARSITRAASGGELSRVMLAIEVATATPQTAVPTFVFDEVDSGVGGRAALDVGARLAALAANAQVVVVTHLAQVAAYADRHLVVRKSDDGKVTSSGVHEVTGTERARELARMMAGIDSEVALDHARDLLARTRGGGVGAGG